MFVDSYTGPTLGVPTYLAARGLILGRCEIVPLSRRRGGGDGGRRDLYVGCESAVFTLIVSMIAEDGVTASAAGMAGGGLPFDRQAG